MDYAINTLTNRIESADQATGSDPYLCPCCKAMMSLHAGAIRKKYFAHWPGLGTAACENYVPAQGGQSFESSALKIPVKRRMDLRLVIPKESNRARWSLELVMPSWRACDAAVIVDVGGRLQKLDMRRASSGARVMAELSEESFRIVSFEGRPDPFFKDSIEAECLGLPVFGAAAFTAAGRGEGRGFPRAQELKCAGTYALLWKEPAAIVFPDELVLDWFKGRQGWSLALITVPEKPSSICVEWLQEFTGLTVNAPAPYIVPVWPFLTRNSSISTIEYAESSIVILSAHMASVGHPASGLTLQVYSGSDRISATCTYSPAHFILVPERAEAIRVGKSGDQDLERILTKSSVLRKVHSPPSIELVFTDQDGKIEVAGIHQKKCKLLVAAARAGAIALSYLAMPPETVGNLLVRRPSGSYETKIFAGFDTAAHNRRQYLMPKELQDGVVSDLIDARCDVSLNFYGFGQLQLSGDTATCISRVFLPELKPGLRSRIYSYMLQLQAGVPLSMALEDHKLVQAFCLTTPKPSLIPHHRALMKKIIACGFQIDILGKGLLS